MNKNTATKLNNLLDMINNQPTTSRANVGETFVHTTSNSYTHYGNKLCHEYDIMWIVTAVSDTGITCERVEILAERNRPTMFIPRNAPQITQIAHFAVEDYSNKGTISWI